MMTWIFIAGASNYKQSDVFSTVGKATLYSLRFSADVSHTRNG